MENGLHVCEDLSQTKLDRVLGEVKALECRWSDPESLLHDHHHMYAGIGEENDLDEEEERLNHQHHVYDRDRDEFWDGILAYLHMGWLPSSKTGREDSEVFQEILHLEWCPMAKEWGQTPTVSNSESRCMAQDS